MKDKKKSIWKSILRGTGMFLLSMIVGSIVFLMMVQVLSIFTHIDAITFINNSIDFYNYGKTLTGTPLIFFNQIPYFILLIFIGFWYYWIYQDYHKGEGSI